MWIEYGCHFAHSIYTRKKPRKLKKSNEYSMGTTIQYPMGMGICTDMGMIFENRYGCRYDSTQPEPALHLSYFGEVLLIKGQIQISY